MNQNLKKYLLIFSALILIIVINFFVPNSFLRKIFSFSGKNVAAAFTSSTSGDWNVPATWGLPDLASDLHLTLNDHAGNTVVTDSIGDNDATATFNTDASSVTGKINNALHFDGFSDSISVPDLSFGDNNFSEFLWINTTYDQVWLITHNGDSGLLGIGTGVSDPNKLSFYDDVSWHDSTGININDGVWHHIGITKNGTAYTFWIDGIPEAFTGNPDLTLSGGTFIAKYSTNDINNFGGDIDDIRLFTRALTESDVEFIYNSGAGTEENFDVTGPTPEEGTDYPGPSDDITLNTETVTLTQDQNVHSIELASGGTLDLNGHTLNIYGDWTNSGGTLSNSSTTASSTVNFVGAGEQKILGENTFENLTKNSTTTSSLLFDWGATTTITGTLSLSGTSGNLLSIGPSIGILPIFDFNISNGIEYPQGVFVDDSSNLYVSYCSDPIAPTISKYDYLGNFISTIYTFGTTPDSSHCPLFMSKDSDNNLYVPDAYNSEILKFNSSNELVNSTTSPDISYPFSIAADNNGFIYITNSGNNIVSKYDSNLNFITSTTTYNGNDFSLCDGGISYDSIENVLFVADTCNNTIVRLNLDLSFVDSSTGPAEEPFTNPVYVAYDSDDNLYISNEGWGEPTAGAIEILNPDYSFKGAFGSYGSDPDQFDNPQQISIDNTHGLIFIGDGNGGNHRVDVWKIPSNSSTFNIVYTGSSIPDLGHLSVSGSYNQSDTLFDCTNGCVNQGSNTNWTFPIITTHNVVRRHNRNSLLESSSTSEQVNQNRGASTSTSDFSISTTSTSTPKNISIVPFTKNLKFGSISIEVTQLQTFLKKLGFLSIEKETSYFGILTKKAVIKFQEANFDSILKPVGLKKGTGNFFEQSRVKANEILNQGK